MSNKLCIYHAHCTDGFGAAWVVWDSWGDDCEYVAASYNSPPPDVTGKTVYIVDFSYPRDVMLEMAAQAERIVVLDHHDTAEKELVDLPDNVEVTFDQNHSGAMLAWKHFNDVPPPRLIAHIEDRDLWRFDLPGTKRITAALFSYEMDFPLWSKLMNSWDELLTEGTALLRKHNKEVQALCETPNVRMLAWRLPDGSMITVPAVNCPWMFASDVGHELCNRYADSPFSVTYMLTREGAKFSLRSNSKVHCGEIAQEFGGGGHPNAAGFYRPLEASLFPTF